MIATTDLVYLQIPALLATDMPIIVIAIVLGIIIGIGGLVILKIISRVISIWVHDQVKPPGPDQ